jgi:hypothetical protein
MRLFDAILYWLDDRRAFGKVGLAILVAAVPVFGFFAIKGWEFEISHAVRHGREGDLPPWRRPLRLFSRGFAIRLAGILYNLPTYFLLGFGLLLTAASLVQFFQTGPLTWEAFGAALTQQLPLRLSVIALAGLYALAANILYWSGYLRYIETRDFLLFFDVIENARLAFRNIWDDLLMAVFMFFVTLVTGLIGTGLTALLTGLAGIGITLAPIVVPAIVLTLNTLIQGHLYGQLARRTLG